MISQQILSFVKPIDLTNTCSDKIRCCGPSNNKTAPVILECPEKFEHWAAVALQGNEHQEERWIDIATEVGIASARSTVGRTRIRPLSTSTRALVGNENRTEPIRSANSGIFIQVEYWGTLMFPTKR